MSSQIGKNIKISIFGESHGEGIGAVIDGFPPGVKIQMDELSAFMERRAPGNDPVSTPRKEADIPNILSGMKEDVTCGTPITCVIANTNTRSADYKNVATVARPGHSDYTGFLRYKGFNDLRGGGHFSARLTAPLVFAGGLCKQYLEQQGIFIGAHLASVHDVNDDSFDPVNLTKEQLLGPGHRSFPVICREIESQMRQVIEEARRDLDSVGGVVEVAVIGLPGGLGSPMFDSVEGRLSYGFFGIPAVKAVSFGAGFDAAFMKGSENNDPFCIIEDETGRKQIRTITNHHGGILGGITSGMPITAKLAFKPTPSISKEQKTVDYVKMEETALSVIGRHDPCVAVRAVPVVEAVAAIIIMDILLERLE